MFFGIMFFVSVLAFIWIIPQLAILCIAALFGYYQTEDNVWHYSTNYALKAWGLILFALIVTAFGLI